jgi:hypothetical protein
VRSVGSIDKDNLLQVVKTYDGGHLAYIINSIAPGVRLVPEKLYQHLAATQWIDNENGGWAKIYLYLDSGVYIKITVEYDKETKQITNAEVDFNHLAECYCGE